MINMKNVSIRRTSLIIILILSLGISQVWSQQVEVQGELNVSQMNVNENGDDLVIRNTNGTLGTRSVASLPPPPPPIDTTRNLASDYELAKYLCNCPNLPPFMIQQLLNSGYTESDLIAAGVPVQEVIDAQRMGTLIDPRTINPIRQLK